LFTIKEEYLVKYFTEYRTSGTGVAVLVSTAYNTGNVLHNWANISFSNTILFFRISYIYGKLYSTRIKGILYRPHAFPWVIDLSVLKTLQFYALFLQVGKLVSHHNRRNGVRVEGVEEYVIIYKYLQQLLYKGLHNFRFSFRIT
jgi:hypothetical protein